MAQIIEENKKALTAKGTLRDHRGLVLNFDDYLRCCGVPKHKDANFRHMAGVIVHKDGAHLSTVDDHKIFYNLKI